MKYLLLVIALTIACGTVPAGEPFEGTLDVELKTGSAKEQQSRRQLSRILSRHDLSPWLFTRRIRIASGEVPHSHPVLTLNTRHLDRDVAQLSTLLHEQIHWYLESDDRRPAVENVLRTLREHYPELPSADQLGTRSEDSSYLHLLVNWLEWDALRQIIGERAARAEIRQKDHYTWIYQRILQDDKTIRRIVDSEGLIIRKDDSRSAG